MPSWKQSNVSRPPARKGRQSSSPANFGMTLLPEWTECSAIYDDKVSDQLSKVLELRQSYGVKLLYDWDSFQRQYWDDSLSYLQRNFTRWRKFRNGVIYIVLGLSCLLSCVLIIRTSWTRDGVNDYTRFLYRHWVMESSVDSIDTYVVKKIEYHFFFLPKLLKAVKCNKNHFPSYWFRCLQFKIFKKIQRCPTISYTAIHHRVYWMTPHLG